MDGGVPGVDPGDIGGDEDAPVDMVGGPAARVVVDGPGLPIVHIIIDSMDIGGGGGIGPDPNGPLD